MRNQLWHDVRAFMLLGGAENEAPLTLDDVAHGSHVEHTAASSIVDSSQATPFLDEDALDRREEGGAFTASMTWLEAMPRRFGTETGGTTKVVFPLD